MTPSYGVTHIVYRHCSRCNNKTYMFGHVSITEIRKTSEKTGKKLRRRDPLSSSNNVLSVGDTKNMLNEQTQLTGELRAGEVALKAI